MSKKKTRKCSPNSIIFQYIFENARTCKIGFRHRHRRERGKCGINRFHQEVRRCRFLSRRGGLTTDRCGERVDSERFDVGGLVGWRNLGLHRQFFGHFFSWQFHLHLWLRLFLQELHESLGERLEGGRKYENEISRCKRQIEGWN